MLKLSKTALSERSTLMQRLAELHQQLDTAIEAYNAAMAEAWGAVQEALDAYNEVVQEAQAWVEDQTTQMDEYIAERSEKWVEGERGQQYEGWKQQYESTQLEEIEIEQPETLDLPSDDQSTLLDELPAAWDEA
jgi:hypothetical protein